MSCSRAHSKLREVRLGAIHWDRSDARQTSATRSQAKAEAFSAIVAWSSIALGAISGLIMGLWSFGGPFPLPEMIGAYDALPRRFLRLAHIAFFALGMLHLMVLRQVRSARPYSRLNRHALRAMTFGNITMSPILIAAAFWDPIKYLAAFPALSLTFAFSSMAYSSLRYFQGGPHDKTRNRI